jgi:2-hydroxycyclohexanecarboxyl-CoA dehydrogenase
MGLNGKVALVTGGARGIGRAIVLRLAREGAKVAICDVLPDEAIKVVDEVKKAGGECIFIEADVTHKDEIDALVKAIEDKYGTIDILVNNAGGPGEHRLFADTDEESWGKVIDLNFWGPLKVTKAVLRIMISHSSGNIVNIGSESGRIGAGYEVVYSACKGGIIAFTKSLARELARHSIRVNCVCPGPTETPLVVMISKENPEFQTKLEKSIPMRRRGRPEEIAAAVLFLVSDEANYITGQVLSVSGGITMI